MRPWLVLTALLFASQAWAWAPAKFNKVVEIGQKAPDWTDLAGVDGKRHSLKDYAQAKVLVVVFLANPCPVAGAYEHRLVEFAGKFQPEGVQLVAICASQSEADSLPRMKERAKAGKFNFPYLHDPSQKSARELGALVTPHLFVFDAERKVAYMGAFDDANLAANVERHYVRDAVAALLAGKPVETTESRPRGCAIDYAE